MQAEGNPDEKKNILVYLGGVPEFCLSLTDLLFLFLTLSQIFSVKAQGV